MDKKVKRYYRLKQMQKKTESELAELRAEILAYLAEAGTDETEVGGCSVKLVRQERREYSDVKLYDALPDPELWKLVSKADAAKIAGLLKLNVFSEERIKEAYTLKNVVLLQVDKK